MRSDTNDTLGQIWAATRPEEPSAAAFDALWSEVTARVDEPKILPISGFANWRRWGLGAAMLAQAAALLIAAVVALSPPKPIEIAGRPIPKVPEFSGEAGYTTYVSLGVDSLIQGVEIRPQAVESDTDVVTAEADILGFMESCESITPPAVVDFTESYGDSR